MSTILQKELKGHRIALRKPLASDAAFASDYWFGPKSEHLRTIIDMAAMGDQESFQRRMETSFSSLSESGPWSTLICDIDGEPSGTVLINNVIPKEDAFIHVHIWNPTNRRLGIASNLARGAIQYFFENFDLKKLTIQIPSINPPAIELVKSLGFKEEGTFFGKAAPICLEGNYVRFTIARDSV